jgi:hypothetical protein
MDIPAKICPCKPQVIAEADPPSFGLIQQSPGGGTAIYYRNTEKRHSDDPKSAWRSVRIALKFSIAAP